jgi:NAD(P)-dependent dehydrogenase (short-subunit alcohol dehydrogenase family)
VRANAVGPGFVPTPGTGDVYDDEQVRAIRASVVPLRRLGEPVDVANVVGFLAGPDSAYVTGQVIYVDGGVTESLMTLIPRPANIPGPQV